MPGLLHALSLCLESSLSATAAGLSSLYSLRECKSDISVLLKVRIVLFEGWFSVQLLWRLKMWQLWDEQRAAAGKGQQFSNPHLTQAVFQQGPVPNSLSVRYRAPDLKAQRTLFTWTAQTWHEEPPAIRVSRCSGPSLESSVQLFQHFQSLQSIPSSSQLWDKAAKVWLTEPLSHHCHILRFAQTGGSWAKPTSFFFVSPECFGHTRQDNKKQSYQSQQMPETLENVQSPF